MVDEDSGDAAATAAAAVAHDDSSGAQQQQQQTSSTDLDATGVIPSQAVPVVGVPNYPNCIAWSEENLLAVGAGHLVTILNPASMSGPRGFIPVAPSPIFDFGRVQPEDLKAHSLFGICLARDPRPGVRSIDWSPPGLAQNGGSLLAMCTTDGRVKVYRTPFCDFQSEWIEIQDLSEMVFTYCSKNNFRETEQAAAQLASEEKTIPPPLKWGFRLKRKLPDDDEPQHRKVQKARHHTAENVDRGYDLAVVPAGPEVSIPDTDQQNQVGVLADEAQPTSIVKGARVEVLEEDEDVQYWVGGSVAEIMNGEALVKLDQPQYGAMEEWVPLQGTEDSSSDEETDQLSPGKSTGQQVMRTKPPRIRPQIVMANVEESITDDAGHERSLVNGASVEAWINERWQEGTVLEVQESGVSVTFPASSVSAIVELRNIRLAPFWNGKRWVWRTTGVVSKEQTSGAFDNSHLQHSTTVQYMGHNLPNPSSEGQLVGQRGYRIQSLGGKMRGQVATSLALDFQQDCFSLPVQPGSGQDLSHDLTKETEKPYSRVYKRRSLVTTAGLPSDSLGTVISTTRPARNRRLPSKLRTGDTVPWMTEADGSMLPEYELAPENLPQDEDGEYLQGVKGGKDGGKAKNVRPGNNAAKLKEAESVKDTGTLKGAQRSKVGEKEKQNNNEINENSTRPKLISPHEFAARSEFLTPLSLAWSSKYEDQGTDDGSGGSKAKKFALLGAGMKSGRVSLWRMAFPPSYSIDHADVHVTASFLGFLYAHDSWVNNLSWASCCTFYISELNARKFPHSDGQSGDTLLLATGCAEGSVKLWAGLSRELTGSDCENGTVPFLLLREVVKADYSPVTALALSVPLWPGDRALLAIGKGSGSVEVWELKSSGDVSQIFLQPCAHRQVVTGFSWTPDGRCLYSCGQDSLKRWDVSQDQLPPLPFPDGSSVFPPNTASDICSLEALESFFGVTLSPNGLALAAVRGIASDLLDQMYQARSQKGMVQLFWLGNEHIDVKNENHATLPITSRPLKKPMSDHDKACWELNIINALERLQDPRKSLVLWDLITALLSLKEKLGVEGVVSILSKWLTRWGPGQGAVGAVDSHEWSTGSFQKAIPEASCRRLQLMNVLYRRLLSDVKTGMLRPHSSEDPLKADDVEINLWKEGVSLVEHELRQRLVHINLLSAASGGRSLKNDTEASNSLLIQHLVEWVLRNSVEPELGKFATRLLTIEENKRSSPMEACTFCDSTVALESPEIATCYGSHIKHRLQRCSVSMQVCPPVCLWHCSCCGRPAIRHASCLFFSLSSREHITELSLPVHRKADSLPFCPFCGILMHRLLPTFFLTPSLV